MTGTAAISPEHGIGDGTDVSGTRNNHAPRGAGRPMLRYPAPAHTIRTGCTGEARLDRRFGRQHHCQGECKWGISVEKSQLVTVINLQWFGLARSGSTGVRQ
jgi:hypothetical protein